VLAGGAISEAAAQPLAALLPGEQGVGLTASREAMAASRSSSA
jgi:hypothetical protein